MTFLPTSASGCADGATSGAKGRSPERNRSLQSSEQDAVQSPDKNRETARHADKDKQGIKRAESDMPRKRSVRSTILLIGIQPGAVRQRSSGHEVIARSKSEKK